MALPTTYLFPGTSSSFVVIVAGIHTSEQSGVEIANWIRVKLAKRAEPTRLGAVIIPEVFPQRGLDARKDEWRDGVSGLDKWREIMNGKIKPARLFPTPGRPLSSLLPRRQLVIDGTSVPLLPEIEHVIRAIESIKPVRIVSVHGKRPRKAGDLSDAKKIKMIDMSDDDIKKWDGTTIIRGVNFPGIYVDPRYVPTSSCQREFEVEACKFQAVLDPAFPLLGDPTKKRFDSAVTDAGRKDDAVALAAAKAVSAIDKTLVLGNHVDDPPQQVHYAKEPGTPKAWSLGDWGPVEVKTRSGDAGDRSGAPVFTIETKDNDESWAFLDGVQVMSEDGRALPQTILPSDRVRNGQQGPPQKQPAKFRQDRSKQLQAYAEGIIGTILDLP
jgi:hypothetical protein